MNSELNLAAALATVGKTEEQLKAERLASELAAKQAEWNRMAAIAQAADSTHCQGSVGSSAFRSRRCNNSAKFHREEHLIYFEKESPLVTRHYCAQHDEVSKREKQAVRNAVERKAREATWAAEERMRLRSSLMSKVIGGVPTSRLQELVDAGVTLETLLAVVKR